MRQEHLAGQPALDLAARGLGDAAPPDQHHGVDVGLVLLGDRPAYRGRQRSGIPLKPPVDLLHDDQVFLLLDVHREGRATPGTQRRMARLAGQLQVLGVEVAAAQNDQVFDAAGDAQHAVGPHESQVAGTQKRPFALGGARREGMLALLRPIPITPGHALARHPDLTDPIRRAGFQGLRIDDAHLLAEPGNTAAGQVLGVRMRLGRGDHPVPGQRLALHRQYRGAREPLPAGDEERRLGHAIAGVEGLAAETAVGKLPGKFLQGRRTHRLGAVEGDRPAGKVELPALFYADLADAELVGEVGATAGDAVSVMRNRFQPA